MKRLSVFYCIFLLINSISIPLNAQTKLVEIEIVKQNKKQELWARNNSSGNLTLTIVYSELNNAYSDPYEPTATLAPGEYKQIATISPTGNGAWNYRYDYFWRLGTPDAYPDGTVYQLPYESGTSYKIVQGYNGSITHFGDQAYAIDFGMKIGTPIHAARGGKVVEVVQENDGAGTTEYYRKHSNHIRIEHSDGTIAEYTHIKQYGATVSNGDMVQTGDLIGYSGNVGYSTGPHLHFHVCRPINGKDIETLSVLFRTSNSESEELLQGNVYTAP